MTDRHAPLALACAFLFLLTALPLTAQAELLKLEAVASYYGAEFNGRPTSSGELFNMNDFTAAHKTLPFGTILEITNLENGKKVSVRVNDRGPFVASREIDVSQAAAEALGMITAGTARVSIRKLASPAAAAATPTAAPAQPTATAPVSTEPASTRSATADPEMPVAGQTANAAPRFAAATAPAMAVAPPENGPGASWRIQMGSFSREDNATRLAIKLRGDGFNPSFERTETLIRVVLTGIPGTDLAGLRAKLENAGYDGFLVRQEKW